MGIEMTNKEPEALRLAYFFESMKKSSNRWYDGTPVHEKAATELRLLHAESEQHLQELAAYRFTVENLRARVAELEAQLAEAANPTQQGMDAEYQRGYQDGYNRRDAEVKGALV